MGSVTSALTHSTNQFQMGMPVLGWDRALGVYYGFLGTQCISLEISSIRIWSVRPVNWTFGIIMVPNDNTDFGMFNMALLGVYIWHGTQDRPWDSAPINPESLCKVTSGQYHSHKWC